MKKIYFLKFAGYYSTCQLLRYISAHLFFPPSTYLHFSGFLFMGGGKECLFNIIECIGAPRALSFMYGNFKDMPLSNHEVLHGQTFIRILYPSLVDAVNSISPDWCKQTQIIRRTIHQ
jgi:hypothetical protein